MPSDTPTFDVIDVPGPPERADVPPDLRPALRAETLPPGGRLALLGLIVVGALLTLATIVAALTLPGGVYALGTTGAIVVGAALMLIWLLQILFGALLEHERTIGVAAHRAWIAAFVVGGPFALGLYWLIHVWRAPYVPEDEPTSSLR